MTLRPDVAPYALAKDDAIPLARPRELLQLRDGGSLSLTAAPVRRVLFGRTVTMLGFNGQYPGPLIQVDEGSTIIVRFTNRTDFPTAVHWHGVRLDNRFDGAPHVTQDPVPPGGHVRLHASISATPGIYWYHPHHREDVLQDLGLYGNLLVRSRDPDFFAPANREEILMLDDLLVGEAGPIELRPRSADARADGTLRQRAARQRRAAMGRRARAAAKWCGSFSPTCRARASSTCRCRDRARA